MSLAPLGLADALQKCVDRLSPPSRRRCRLPSLEEGVPRLLPQDLEHLVYGIRLCKQVKSRLLARLDQILRCPDSTRGSAASFSSSSCKSRIRPQRLPPGARSPQLLKAGRLLLGERPG